MTEFTEFKAREPNTPAEAELLDIQQSFDVLGKVAWQAVINGQGVDRGVAREQEELRGAASEILNGAVASTQLRDFVARYFYETNPQEEVSKKLIYPHDSHHYVATLSGVLEGVHSYPVRHPAPDRNGDVGFRLCARIEATRAIGMVRRETDPASFFIPVGELYLNGHSEPNASRLRDESLRPNQIC